MYFLLKNYIPTLYFSFTHTHTLLLLLFSSFLFSASSLGRLAPPLASSPRSGQKRRSESFVLPFIQPDKSSTTACVGQGRKFSQLSDLSRWNDPARTNSILQPIFSTTLVNKCGWSNLMTVNTVGSLNKRECSLINRNNRRKNAKLFLFFLEENQRVYIIECYSLTPNDKSIKRRNRESCNFYKFRLIW